MQNQNTAWGGQSTGRGASVHLLHLEAVEEPDEGGGQQGEVEDEHDPA
jgi:hypothetical protein